MRRVVLVSALAMTASSVLSTAPPAHAAPNAIVAVGAVFAPGEIVVPQGTGVTFVNLDADFHDVTSTAGEFASATIGRGAAKVVGVESLTPNTYTYYCTVHEGMLGLITVV